MIILSMAAVSTEARHLGGGNENHRNESPNVLSLFLPHVAFLPRHSLHSLAQVYPQQRRERLRRRDTRESTVGRRLKTALHVRVAE